MSSLGDFAVGVTIDHYFTTRRFSTGAPYTLAGTPVISAYEDNGITEITVGITLTTDFDARTGLNHVRIVATGANGFEAGKSYSLVLTAGTVDGVSVAGETVGSFTLERASSFSRLGAPVGASISADIAAVQADTDNVQTRIPAALVSGRMDSSIGAYQTGLTPLQPTVAGRTLDVAATGEAGVDLDNTAGTLAKGTDLTGFTDLDAAGVRTAVGLATANLDTQLDVLPTAAETAASVWASGTRTLTALGSSLIAEVWNALTSGLLTVGSVGKLIVDYLNTSVSSRASQASLDNHETSRASMQTVLVAEHDATQATLADATSGLAALNTDLDTLLTRLSATRAGYLDNLSGGAVGLEATLTAMKGAGWTTETLKAIKDALITAAQVNAEMVDALAVDTYVEPSGVPSATATLAAKIGWLAHLSRAKRLTTSTSDAVRNDGDTATIASATVSDDGTTFTRGKYT